MASGGILVINPKSYPEVTVGLREAVQPFVLTGGPAIDPTQAAVSMAFSAICSA